MILVQGALLVITAILMGLEASLGSILIVLGVVALLGGSFSAVSYGLALKLKSEDAFAPLLNGVLLPTMLLSGILLPTDLAPGWLETISKYNPIAYVVEGGRAVFLDDIVSSEAGIGLAITLVLVALGVVYGTRMFRRESA